MTAARRRGRSGGDWFAVVAAVLLALPACSTGEGRVLPDAIPPASGDCGGVEPPRPDGTTWTCTWSDEFDGSALGAVWEPIPYGLGSSCLLAEPEFAEVADGELHLTARRLPGDHWCTREFGLAYGGGGVQTQGTMAQQYGRFEIRAQFPAGAGFWPAFWLLPDDDTYSGEIDIVEGYGGRPGNLADATLHVPAAGDGPHEECAVEPDPTIGFHTYTLEWTKDSMLFLYDGRPCAEFTGMSATGTAPPGLSAEFDKPYHVLLDLAVQSHWPPDASTPFPGVLRVDYVRVWR